MSNPRPYPCQLWVEHPEYRAFAQQVEEFKAGRLSPSGFSDAGFSCAIEGYERRGLSRSFLFSHSYLLSQEVQALSMFGQWYSDERKIVDVAPVLVEALRYSDCGDMVIQDLLTPEVMAGGSFYVSLEASGLTLDRGAVSLVGAYVMPTPKSLRIQLCGALTAAVKPEEVWRTRYDLRIPAECYLMPAERAVEQALQTDLADLQRVAVPGQPGADSASVLLEHQRRGHPEWVEAAYLVLNLLAWCVVYPSDAEVVWPEGAPARLVQRCGAGSPKECARAFSKLWSLGWVQVRRVGRDFAARFARPEGIAAHWRRGHWRNQAHGPGFSLRKLIWIWPTMVGGALL